MPFFLDGNPTQGEISEAINYLLGNSQLTTSTNVVNGQVTDAIGDIVSYLYKYLYVKYADSFDGTVNFSNTPTNRQYYGLRNNDSGTESTNPADYIWYQVSGGFSTNKFVFYSVTGGRRINIVVGLSAPSILYQADSGAAIDLDRISGSDGSSSRICYAKSTSFALASTPTTYQTSGPSGFPPYNTWGGAETWQATPPTLGVNEALFQSDGIYNPVTDLTTWNVPYLSNLRVGALSAISANLGTITAGDISVGSSPTISGTTMTGTGVHLYSNGNFITGNATTNMVFNGSQLYLNGFQQLSSSTMTGGLIGNGLATMQLINFTVTAAAANKPLLVLVNGSFFAGNPLSGGVYLYQGTTWFICQGTFYIQNSAGTIVSDHSWYIPSSAIRLTSGERTGAFPLLLANMVSLPADTYNLKLQVSSTCYDNNAGVSLGNADSYYQTVRSIIYVSTI